MKQIFIDKFTIPQSAVDEIVPRMNYSRSFIKKLPGFLRDEAYQRVDENGNTIIITIAVWESDIALKNAKETVQIEYNRIGFNPSEFLPRLGVTMERGIYNEMLAEESL